MWHYLHRSSLEKKDEILALHFPMNSPPRLRFSIFLLALCGNAVGIGGTN
jgi:hypothetical protein